ncbi:methyltransferase family protein [Fundidesulfovibrio terrae]|uniref:methyltransferase family protein n=1 Tax=Fundidesulfovibrio terrae TaxID=2922866 RepID=UPI001FB0206C|nr:isoprenylcysteine carboxylmethyltransferase family protein [Fundidesulfovibrio terrae]
MIVKLVAQTLLWLLFTSLLLFWAAGSLWWPAGWVYLALNGACGLGGGLWLARVDPDLLGQRLGSPFRREQAPFDKVFMAVFLPLYHAWLVFMAVDAARFGWSHVPFWLRFAGALFILAGNVTVGFAFRVNTFAIPLVKVQSERRQKVIDTGPYAVVRHPLYAGELLSLAGSPLLLGSWAGLAGVIAVFLPLLAVRAVLEERLLSEGLAGYAQYAGRVRFRLIPGVW